MSSGRHKFTESEVKRMIRITEKAGLEVSRIDYHRDNTGTHFSIIPRRPTKDAHETHSDDEWATT
jgi:hypothetical protein